MAPILSVTQESIERHTRNGDKFQCVRCHVQFKEGDLIFFRTRKGKVTGYYHQLCSKPKMKENSATSMRASKRYTC